MVVIDDLQWLDPSSVGMVELLIDRCAAIRWSCWRPPAPEHRRRGRRARPDVEVIRLTGLDEPDTARLATIIARAAVDADGARRIHERTGSGRALRRRDGACVPRGRHAPLARRSRGDDRDWWEPCAGHAPGDPGGRIDALPPSAREALGVASVIGIAFRASTVEALLDRPLEPDAFEQLADDALVVPHDDRWRFAHSLIHDARMPVTAASRRRVLHARLADRLEAGPETSTPSQIAAHRIAAGEITRAIPLLREAAESALALGAVTEAAEFWREAADLAAGDDPQAAGSDRTRAADALAAIDTRVRRSRRVEPPRPAAARPAPPPTSARPTSDARSPGGP